MKHVIVLLALLFTIGLGGCAAAPAVIQAPVQINAPWIRAAANGANTAAFMVIKNTAGQDDRLIKAEASVSTSVGLMTTGMKDGKMTMQMVEAIAVPASGQVELKSGGFHVMFMGLKQELKAGDKIHLTLTFEKGGAVALDVPVQAAPTTP